MTKYLAKSNRNIPWQDWRSLDLKQELFFRYINWRFAYGDIDHFNWNLAYAGADGEQSPTGKPMTREQRIWFSLLFGMTYQSSMAWCFYWHFPNFNDIDLNALDKWNRETMPLQKFGTDARYNKGHIVKIVQSIQSFVDDNGGSIEKAFDSLLEDDSVTSFHNVSNQIREFYKYGRMCTWLATQALYEVANLPIEPDTMFSADSGNHTIWNGMMNYYGVLGKNVGKNSDYKPTANDKEWILSKEPEIYAETLDHLEHGHEFFSYFTLETHICQFKRIYTGSEYPGHSTGDAILRWKQLRENWKGIVNYDAMENAIESNPALIRDLELCKPFDGLLQRTGQLINMHEMYDDVPNMYDELGINRESLRDMTPDVKKTVTKKIDDYEKQGNGSSVLQFMR